MQTLRYLSTRHPDPPIQQNTENTETIVWTTRRRSWLDFKLDEELVARVRDQREVEWEGMQCYIDCADQCLMTTLRRMLDDETLTGDAATDRCGKCCNCVGRSIVPTRSSQRLAEDAVSFFKQRTISFPCKTVVPSGFDFASSGLRLVADSLVEGEAAPLLHISEPYRAENGLALSNWMDVGWGIKVHDDKKNKQLSDELVKALANAIRSQPFWQQFARTGWVTCVPSKAHRKLVPDFAYRLAANLNLKLKKVIVHKDDNHEPQKTRKNNHHRCYNLDGTFKVKEQVRLPRGPVLLVDDIVRSTWTVTVIAALLRQAGSGKVFPVALARIGTED